MSGFDGIITGFLCAGLGVLKLRDAEVAVICGIDYRLTTDPSNEFTNLGGKAMEHDAFLFHLCNSFLHIK